MSSYTRSALFTILSRSVNCRDESWLPDGVSWDSFGRSPLVLRDHADRGRAFPIGSSLSLSGELEVWTNETKVIARCFFDSTPDGQEALDLVLAGKAQGASMGLAGREYIEPWDCDIRITKSVALEWSILFSMEPANPQCLMAREEDLEGLTRVKVRRRPSAREAIHMRLDRLAKMGEETNRLIVERFGLMASR